MTNHPNRKRRVASVASAPAHDHDRDYARLLDGVERIFGVAQAHGPLFVTDADVWKPYLRNLGRQRGVHDCHACRTFMKNFGGLANITEDGHVVSALWARGAISASSIYTKAINEMALAVGAAKVIKPFISKERELGFPGGGKFTHFAVNLHEVYKGRVLTPGQAMAAKIEDFKTVEAGLAEYGPAVIAKALSFLEDGHLQRGEKFTGPLHWLANLHAIRAGIRDKRRRDNLLWRAVATAPEGFCHPKSSVIGTLLDDILAGLPFADVKRKFEAKVGGLIYQRPQAAPKAGNIAAAEKIVATMGIERSLKRRFARLDEIELAWSPADRQAPKRPRGGVFAHLATNVERLPPRLAGEPAAVMTWEKFSRLVLPAAEKIRVRIDGGRMPLIALTTAVHADAPPVLKWDRPEERNPVAWYVYHGGSVPSAWGLHPGTWETVTGIAALPPMWGSKPQPHLGEGYILLLKACKDSSGPAGNALFPECLSQDLHAVRSTIEAHSRSERLSGLADASACGLDIRKGMAKIGYHLRVTAGGIEAEYRLDRWD